MPSMFTVITESKQKLNIYRLIYSFIVMYSTLKEYSIILTESKVNYDFFFSL
jgi:hypothetical protein